MYKINEFVSAEFCFARFVWKKSQCSLVKGREVSHEMLHPQIQPLQSAFVIMVNRQKISLEEKTKQNQVSHAVYNGPGIEGT